MKLRTWDKFENKMISWEEMTKDTPSEQLLIESLLNSVRYTPMLSTELFDINGVEIYQGDIIKIHNNTKDTSTDYWFPEYIIERKKTEFVLEYFGGGKCIGSLAIFLLKYYSKNQVEVIGNIFENPEKFKDELSHITAIKGL